MFLCAVARPQYNPHSKTWWDGKLGNWPIGDWEPPQRRSKNRPRETLVWKNKTVTKQVYRNLLIANLLSSNHGEMAKEGQPNHHPQQGQ